MLYRRARSGDYEKIIALQDRNLLSAQTSDLSGGFLATQHTAAHFQQMNETIGVVVCEKDQEIIGYLGSCNIDFFRQFPIAGTMINKLVSLNHQGAPLDLSRVVFTNPVCIDENYRGQGIYLTLCQTLLPLFPKHYKKAITLVSAENKRSLTATSRLGFEIIDTFEVNNKIFYGMMIDLSEFSKNQCQTLMVLT